MKNLIAFITVISLFTSCNSPISNKENTDKTELAYSSSYVPPTFSLDNRKDKIRNIVNELKPLFNKHIENKHIPGVAYGIVNQMK